MVTLYGDSILYHRLVTSSGGIFFVPHFVFAYVKCNNFLAAIFCA